MKNLDKCYNVVLQSSAKGISAVEIAGKLDIHRTTVHGYLNSLELMGKVESEHGIWRAKTGEQTIKPLEKEIVIELPLPKDQWQRMALLEILAKDCERERLPEVAETYRTLLEKFRETRTIKIKGKNVDDLDLEKLGNLIQQANEKSSKVNLRGLFKRLKRSRANNPQREGSKCAHELNTSPNSKDTKLT
jgi:DNA-binding Lrp family transcriptional regulator